MSGTKTEPTLLRLVARQFTTSQKNVAEYRPTLRDNRECDAVLMDILDVFVRVGQPTAHQLTYRLDEIYR